MKICVLGLWHLGSTAAACLASAGFETIGLDSDEARVGGLKQGVPPLYEPGLAELVEQGLADGMLTFTTDTASALKAVSVLWITIDTAVDDDDEGDVDAVLEAVESAFPHIEDGTTVLVSSQLPVGTTALLERHFALQATGREVSFAYSPENLRLGNAIEAFMRPERIVVGVRGAGTVEKLKPLLSKFSDKLQWTSIESAEMSKHALNAYLATSITFANEVAAISEQVGADAVEVEAALRSDPRVGRHAYVRPGPAFAGGTLARDVAYLNRLATENHLELPLLASVIPSNRAHRDWPIRKLEERLGQVAGRSVGVLGLAYKPGTDAVRRSVGIDVCRWLARKGAAVRAYDPKVSSLPEALEGAVSLVKTPLEAIRGADAAVVATEWPEFRDLQADDFVYAMNTPLVIDPGRLLAQSIATDERIEYVAVGVA